MTNPASWHRLQAEIPTMRLVLQENREMRDEVTSSIRGWFQGFEGLIAECRRLSTQQNFYDNVNVIHLSALTSLDLHLRDALSGHALDPEAYLGITDQKTYNSDALYIWISLDKPKEYGERSPLFPNDPRDFMVIPHKVARFFVKWLDSYRAAPDPGREKLRVDSEQLKTEGKRKRLPTEAYFRMKHIFEQGAAARDASAKTTAEAKEKLEKKIEEDAKAFEEDMKKRKDAADAKTATMEEEAKKNLDGAEEEDRKAREEAKRRMDKAESGLDGVEKGIQGLRRDHESVKETLDKGRSDNKVLHQAIDAENARQDQIARDMASGNKNNFLQSVAIIGVAAAASYFSAGMGTGVGVGPAPGGLILRTAIVL